jgi:hypothetical protein
LKLLKDKIGPENFRILSGDMRETSIGSHTAWSSDIVELMKDWELVKRTYAGQEDQERWIALSGRLRDLNMPERGVRNGKVRISG